MKIKTLKEVTNILEKIIGKKQLPILAAMGVLGVASTAISAYKMGLKAEPILEDRKNKLAALEKKDKKYEERKKEINKNTAKNIAKVAIPTAISCVTTSTCIFGLLSSSNKRIAALSLAYTTSEKALNDINKKLKSELGEKKAKAIKDSIIKDKVGSMPKNQKELMAFGPEEVWCKDMFLGHSFKTTANNVRKAINELSMNCQIEMEVTANEFYDILGLPSIPVGDSLVWTVDDLINGTLPITLTTVLSDDDKPCLAIEYDIHVRDRYL